MLRSDPATNVIALFFATAPTVTQQSIGVGSEAQLFSFSVTTPAAPTEVVLQLEPADLSGGQPFNFLTTTDHISFGSRQFEASDVATLGQFAFAVVPEPASWALIMSALGVLVFAEMAQSRVPRFRAKPDRR